MIRRLRSRGDALIGLTLAETGDRMVPVVQYTDTAGHQHVIELSADELVALRGDIDKLLNADQAQVRRWFQALTRPSTEPR